MAHTISIRGGYDIDLPGTPEQRVSDGPPVGRVAILGSDLAPVRPRFAVEAGDCVSAGQPLFTDRHRPEIAFVAPAAGRVERIDLGARRMLSALVIRREGDAAVEAPVPADDPAGLREALLARGLWPAFRTRPFGRIPDPGTAPRAILVTAIDTAPLAADPRAVIEGRQEPFERGLRALTRLADTPVHLCQAPGPALAVVDGVQVTRFAGRHPAGLPSVHAHHLAPARAGRPVWTIGYQDVIAIGQLIATGAYPAGRIVALSGPLAARPRLVRTVQGADLRALTVAELLPLREGQTARIVSGSVLTGREAAFLGRYATQVTLLAGEAPRARPWSERLSRWLGAPGPHPIIPDTGLERALPLPVPAVPLMRALAIGDAEGVRRLGGDRLVEEDLALLSALCTSRADYGALLRETLDRLEAEAA